MECQICGQPTTSGDGFCQDCYESNAREAIRLLLRHGNLLGITPHETYEIVLKQSCSSPRLEQAMKSAVEMAKKEVYE